MYRDSWYDTRMEDLEVLCRSCHRREHDRVKSARQEEFECVFWHTEEMHEFVQERLYRGKPLLKRHRKRLRHIVEMFSDNGGVMFRFKCAMVLHDRVLRAVQKGFRGYAAIDWALTEANKV